MMIDRLLNEDHPRWQVTVFKSRLFGGQNVWLSELQFTSCKFLCFWRCEREHRPAAVTITLTATSHHDVG